MWIAHRPPCDFPRRSGDFQRPLPLSLRVLAFALRRLRCGRRA